MSCAGRILLLLLAGIFAATAPAEAQRRGNRAANASLSFSETIRVPGKPELDVTLSRASGPSDVVLFLFMGCLTNSPHQIAFFSDVARRANRAGIHAVAWNSAQARGQEDHCQGRVSRDERASDAERVRKHLLAQGLGVTFAAIGDSQGADVLVKLSAYRGWRSFIALMPHCDKFTPADKARMIAFAGDKDASAPGAACARWKAEVHRGADAYHGWMYPGHTGGTVHTSGFGDSAPRLYNEDLAKRLSDRIDKWFVELKR